MKETPKFTLRIRPINGSHVVCAVVTAPSQNELIIFASLVAETMGTAKIEYANGVAAIVASSDFGFLKRLWIEEMNSEFSHMKQRPTQCVATDNELFVEMPFRHSNEENIRLS